MLARGSTPLLLGTPLLLQCLSGSCAGRLGAGFGLCTCDGHEAWRRGGAIHLVSSRTGLQHKKRERALLETFPTSRLLATCPPISVCVYVCLRVSTCIYVCVQASVRPCVRSVGMVLKSVRMAGNEQGGGASQGDARLGCAWGFGLGGSCRTGIVYRVSCTS